MKLINKLFPLILFLFFSTFLWAKPNIIRFATVVPEDTSWYREMKKLSDEVRAKTNGQVIIKIYANAKMGDELDAIRKMRTGQADGGAFSGRGLGEIDSAIRIMEMPFLFQNKAEVDYVYEKMFPTFADRFKKQGRILISTGEAGSVYIFSKNPIRSRKDLTTSRIWVWEGDPLAQAFFEVSEIAPIPLPITDVITQLSTGMIDAVYTPPIGAIGFQWWTKVKYMTTPNLNNATGGMVLTKNKWDSMSLTQQKIVLEISKAAGKRITEITRKDNEDAIKTLKNNNLKIVNVDSNSMNEFHQISNKVRQKLTGKGPGHLYDIAILNQVEKLLKDFRANYKTQKKT